MLKLQEIASQDNVDAYKQAFNRDHFDFEIVRQQAETFMERFNEPEAEEEPDYQALAAAMERERADCIKDLEDKLADAKGDVEKTPTSALWSHVESLLRAVEDKLARTLISTREAARLAPDRADALHEEYQRLKRDSLARVRKARSKMSSTPPPCNTSSTNSVPSGRSFGQERVKLRQELLSEAALPKVQWGES